MNARFRSRHSSSSTPQTTSIPAFFRAARPPPRTLGLGSLMPATTRLTPALISASLQGGVFPVWQQGSRVTYTSAPCASDPAISKAWISAWGVPAFLCHPSPTIRPSRTMTQPTAGLGEVLPTPLRASFSARFMYVASVADVMVFPSALLFQQILQLLHEFADIAERAVDRGEAHIGDLVHAVQLLHQPFSDA